MNRLAHRVVIAVVVGIFGAWPATVPWAQDATPRRGFAVTISEPENQAIVFGRTKIAASVKIDHADLVNHVEFIIDDEVIFVDREAPYECYYDFGENAKTWIVRVVAHHKEEVTVSDAVITRKPQFAVVERVDRVVLWLSASDKAGNLLTDLSREDFHIFEGEDEQEILEFYREDRPITLARRPPTTRCAWCWRTASRCSTRLWSSVHWPLGASRYSMCGATSPTSPSPLIRWRCATPPACVPRIWSSSRSTITTASARTTSRSTLAAIGGTSTLR